jgi:hypothetical protein
MTRAVVPPVQAESLPTRKTSKHLLQLTHEAYAKAECSRQRWHLARRKAPEAAARFHQQMLKHQAIARYLVTECQGCHEPR